MSIFTAQWIIKLKRKYLISYLINEVRNLEQFASAQNSWGERPEIILILSKLLCNGNKIFFNGSITPQLEEKIIFTNFFTINDLEKYCDDFIKQTQPFAEGSYSQRPRIIIENEDLYRMKEIETLYFLQAQTDHEILLALQRIIKTAKRLEEHVKQATDAREAILLSLLKPTLQTMLVTLEQVYEVLNHEADEA